jgi:hypothetical protein
MKLFARKHNLTALAVLALLAVTGVAHASSTSGTLTVTGALSDAPTPAMCTIVSLPSVNATQAIPRQGPFPASYSKSASITVNCTASTPFSISAPSDWNSLRVDNQTGMFAVSITSNGASISSTPVAFVGTGADQVIPLSTVFAGWNGRAFDQYMFDRGPISGSVTLSVAY